MQAGIVKTVTPPGREPVTLEEVKAHLRVDGTDSDLMLTSMARSAREHVENETRRALISRGLVVYFDCFSQRMDLPRPPLASVERVEYLDTDGAWQTVDTAIYGVDTVREPGAVVLVSDAAWPETNAVENAVRATLTAGYGDVPSAVPEPLRQACLFHAQSHYDNDPLTIATLRETTRNLLAPYVVHYV